MYGQKTNMTGLYNIMPIENIPSIVRKGILSNNKAEKVRHESVAMQEIQDHRDQIKVPNGLYLHDYANLYFDPRNPMMYKRRDCAESLCVLKISLDVLDVENVVVSDRNASSIYARFFTPAEGIEILNFAKIFAKSWTDPANLFNEWANKSIKCAEVLIPNCVPYEFIVAAAVLNETAKQNLIGKGFDKGIVVSGGMFFRGETND